MTHVFFMRGVCTKLTNWYTENWRTIHGTQIASRPSLYHYNKKTTNLLENAPIFFALKSANCLHWKIRESWTVNAGVGLLYNATWGGRSEETLGYHRWLDKCPRRSGRIVLTSPATQQCECQRPGLPTAALFSRPKVQFPYFLHILWMLSLTSENT